MVTGRNNIVTHLLLSPKISQRVESIPYVNIGTKVPLPLTSILTLTEIYEVPLYKLIQIAPPGNIDYFLFQNMSPKDVFASIEFVYGTEKKTTVPTVCLKSVLKKTVPLLFRNCLNYSLNKESRTRTNYILLRKHKENKAKNFFIKTKQLVTWAEAFSLCRKLEGSLPIFNSREQFETFVELLRFSPSAPPLENYYIGLTLQVKCC